MGTSDRAVLIVENEALILMDLAETFRDAEFQVLLACNASAARILSSKYRETLVALCIDVRLPDGRGDELADELQPLVPDALLLLCTAVSAEEIRCHALTDGVAVLIAKPFTARRVLERVNQHVTTARQLRFDFSDEFESGDALDPRSSNSDYFCGQQIGARQAAYARGSL